MSVKRSGSFMMAFVMVFMMMVTAHAFEIVPMSNDYTVRADADIIFDGKGKGTVTVCVKGLPGCQRITATTMLYHQGIFGIWFTDAVLRDGTEWGETYTVESEFDAVSGRTYKVTVSGDVYSPNLAYSENVDVVRKAKAP